MDKESRRVLLLKSSAHHENEPDPYVNVLHSNAFVAHCIPVLDFRYIRLEEVKSALQRADEYSCLVLTSQRACEAISRVFSLQDWKTQIQPLWINKTTYVVGAATNKAALALDLTTSGSESGSSECLAQLIVKELKVQESSCATLPALFLCGSLKLDTLPTELTTHGIALRCLTVYETSSDPNIEANLQAYTQDKSYPRYIVFYSPSGVSAAYTIMQNLQWPLSHIHIVAIGHTTAAALSKHGVNVAITAQQPTPAHLCEALVELQEQTAAV